MSNPLTLRYVSMLDGVRAPRYAHGSSEDSGMDLFAAEEVVLEPGSWRSVRTGIAIEIPEGYEGQVRPRSGLARRHGLTLLNSPGTIDPGYRGEVHVTLINFGPSAYRIRPGDRIAQLIIAAYVAVRWSQAESLDESRRGSGGFGSTGR